MGSFRVQHPLVTIGGLLCASLGAAALTACSSGITPALVQNSTNTGSRAANHAMSPAGPDLDTSACPSSVLYIVSSGNASVEVYDRSQLSAGPCGHVSGLQAPQGLFVDAEHDLWIADAFGRQVFEFAPGKKAPVLTLTDPHGVPNDVVVDESTGTAYVVDYQNDADPNTLVEVYAKGSTSPTSTLSDPNARNGAYDALDDRGNLYVTFMTHDNKAQVDRWLGGSGSPQKLGLQLISAGGIVTTADGSLAVCDPFGFRCGIFAPGSTTMSHVFGHVGLGPSGGISNKPPWLHPDTLALGRAERTAYVAATSLTTWRYPGPDGRPNHLPTAQFSIPGGAGKGVAVNPAASPGAPF